MRKAKVPSSDSEPEIVKPTPKKKKQYKSKELYVF